MTPLKISYLPPIDNGVVTGKDLPLKQSQRTRKLSPWLKLPLFGCFADMGLALLLLLMFAQCGSGLVVTDVYHM